MQPMKCLSVALIAVGLSAPVLANESNDSLYVPSQHGGFKFAVDPLYLRKNNLINGSDSSYDWGTYAQIGYLFPATGNDITVDYTYLRAGDTEKLDLDDVDLELGQRVTTGAMDFRLFSGVRYSHLNYGLDTGKESLKNLFHGYGIRMGLDARYQLVNGFGLDTHVNTSLVTGTTTSHLLKDSTLFVSQRNSILPELNAKFGVDYTYAIPNSNKNAFVVEVGYQANNYFHFNTDFVNGSGDTTLDGVYLDVKYFA